MSWFSQFLISSIGKKFIMGVTGLFLITFLVVHCTINSMIFFNDGGITFNTYAHFMATNILIRIMEIVLMLGLLLHIVQGLLLAKSNSNARPIKYAVNNPKANSKWYSRSMTLIGTLLLIFLVIHLKDFWVVSRFIGLDDDINGKGDLYALMHAEFQNIFVVLIYCFGVFSLGWHLLHGFSSAFQTFGLNNKKYTPIIKCFGIAFSILIPTIFALMPISIYLNWIK